VVLNLLGRSIELDSLSQVMLTILFIATAILFLIPLLCPPYTGGTTHSGIKGKEEKIFYPAGLAILAFFVAASMSHHLGITAIFIQAAAILTVFVIQGERLDSTRAALRFLTLMSLAAPFFLLAAWRIDLYQRGGQAAAINLEQTIFFVGFGFALWLAVVPFHSWLTTTAAESAPATAAFVLITFPIVAFLTLIHLLADLPLLVDSVELVRAIIIAGVVTAFIGGGFATVQRGFSQLMGYSALYDLGCILTGLGLGGHAAVTTVLAALSVRTLALTLMAIGVSAVRMRAAGDGFAQVGGLAREMPMAVAALMIGGGILAGVPLLAGFGPKWQIIHASAEMNPVLPALLVLGGLGVAIGYLRGLRAMMGSGRGPARSTFAEPRLLLALISLLTVVSILLGLFPALLIEPLQLLTMTVAVPIQ
jgi:formate hydrogenlyase subunit 3/multisubunit Na+/H+ antiporter MnhD subunit